MVVREIREKTSIDGLTAKVGEPAHHLGDLFPGDGLELVGWHGVVDGLDSVDYRAKKDGSDGVM